MIKLKFGDPASTAYARMSSKRNKHQAQCPNCKSKFVQNGTFNNGIKEKAVDGKVQFACGKCGSKVNLKVN